MASNTIKGLTVEIGGDTTKLGKAIKDVEAQSRALSKELGDVNKLLKMDPGNADLLAQKQKILADAVEATRKKLDTLKEAEAQVQKQFERGEVSEEQVRALQREIIATENKMKGYQKAAQATADAMDELGDGSDDAADGVGETKREADRAKRSLDDLADSAKDAGDAGDDMGAKLGNAAKTGLGAVATAAGVAVGALVGSAEASREYRTEMGKLSTAYETAGHSTEAATDTYKTLQGVLGETDQAVEAANHLAKLAQNEEELATWTDIATGVYATFGASLPIENLTEAANETAKTGAITGGLADALNWAGVSEEAFQAQLDACTTEQERQALITETLNGLYSDAADKYRETNAEVIRANEANEAWSASMAEAGAAVEPLLIEVKNMGAALLSDMIPAIKFLLDNLPALGVALAGIAASVVAFKVAAIAATAASKGMTLAQYAMAAAQAVLNAVMSANPIGLIILAITALVTAFMLLWKNCEGFRNFWINLWDNIKSGASTAINAVVNFFKELPERVGAWLTGTAQKVSAWATNLVEKAKEAGSKFLDGVVSFFKNLPYNVGYWLGAALGTIARWVVDTYNKAKEAGSKFLSGAVTFFKELPGRVSTWLTSTVQKVSAWVTSMAAKARETGNKFLNGVVTFFKELPGRVSTWLKNTTNKVASWAVGLVNKGKQAAKDLAASVVNGIKSLPGKVKSVGEDLVRGLWNGIKNMAGWVKDKIKGFSDGVLNGIKDFFGVHSPSKETAWIGRMLDEGLAQGVERSASAPLDALADLSSSMLDEAANVEGLTLERKISHTFSGGGVGGNLDGLLDKLDSILRAVERGQVLTIDGQALVGSTAARYDSTLGQRRALAERGAL